MTDKQPLACSCGSKQFTITLDARNGYRADCAACKAMLRWLGKDRQARKRTAKPIRKSVGRFCVFCNISEEEAREAGMGFEIDHILALVLGGKDEPENVGDMCAACHHAKTARLTRTLAMKRLISKMRGEPSGQIPEDRPPNLER